LFRVGWLFKTETVIMPVFVDYVAGPAWVRGWLPVFSRLGQSLPPVLFAGYLGQVKLQRRALALVTGLMSLLFAAAAVMWWIADSEPAEWMVIALMSVYLGFFLCNGFYQVLLGSIQGKLIRANRRGSLLRLSTFWGTVPAVALGLLLLPRWLEQPGPGFGWICFSAAIGFGLSALVALRVFEVPATPAPDRTSGANCFGASWAAIKTDANLRRLLLVSVLFSAGWMLWPHYQALARERLQLSQSHLVVWVVTQSIAVGVFSLLVGPLADRRGNRLTMQLMIFGAALAPVSAVICAYLPSQWAEGVYWMVYVPLGLTPLVSRVVLNYALEICDPIHHARYQSLANLGLAAPLVVSPLTGWLIDLTGFEWTFFLAAAAMGIAGLVAYGLDEPRHRLTSGSGFGAAQSPE